MELLNKGITHKRDRPVKIMQFGSGNFLRGFFDYMIDVANEQNLFDGDVVLVKPTSLGNLDMFKEQDCQYTVLLRGVKDRQQEEIVRQVSCICDAILPYNEYEKYLSYVKSDDLRFVVSNTTEVGIVYDATDELSSTPPKSYPGKLTQLLFERYKHFLGDVTKGLIILPMELIDNNGSVLHGCVLKLAQKWQLESAFIEWVENACIFANTLVDRIITGYPKTEGSDLWNEWGYQDNLIVAGEPFALWVIETKQDISGELPLDKTDLGVIFTDNLAPYKERKVRILNGVHTAIFAAAFLSGQDYVRESLEDETITSFVDRLLYEEIIPTLSLPKNELEAFAQDVKDRFANPYIKHALLSISLNSVSKWRVRCLPSLLVYVENHQKIPVCLSFSLAALIAFCGGTRTAGKQFFGQRQGVDYQIVDEESVLAFFSGHLGKPPEQLIGLFMSHKPFWDYDLTTVPNLLETVTQDLERIKSLGMKQALAVF